MTPAEASMIEVDGKNKWKTMIQNGSRFPVDFTEGLIFYVRAVPNC